MNNAVFISCKNPEAGKIICAIKEAEGRLRNLGSELEINVGELEIGDDGVAITVSKKKFDDIQREMSECTEKIWNGYEKLRGLGLVKIYQEESEQKVDRKTMEVYSHYGLKRDEAAIKRGEIESIDFYIGRECDLPELTNNMAGFGTDQSQTVIIEYDKGYGYFAVKRIKRGAPKGTPERA